MNLVIHSFNGITLAVKSSIFPFNDDSVFNDNEQILSVTTNANFPYNCYRTFYPFWLIHFTFPV